MARTANDVFIRNKTEVLPGLPKRLQYCRTSILQLHRFLSRSTVLIKQSQHKSNSQDPCHRPRPNCQQSAVSQGSSSATDKPPHALEPGLCKVVALSCKLDKARASLVSPAHYLFLPTHADSSFAPGRFSIGHSIFASETADCEQTWVNTHLPGESNPPRDRVASSQSGLLCELLSRRARSTDARQPWLEQNIR